MIPGSRVPAGMTAANWRGHPHAPWAFRNVAAFLPHAVVPAAPVARDLPDGPPLPALPLDLPAFLAATHADGFIVLHRGCIAFEHYAAGMDAAQRHLSFSVTKALVGLCAETLIAAGAVDPIARAADIVPALAASAFAGANLRSLLDMIDGVAFDEDYANPDADIHRYSKHFWGDGTGGVSAALAALPDRPGRPGFAYRTPVTDVAGLMLEAATGQPLEQLLATAVWHSAGAAGTAHWIRDTGGRVIASTGFACTLRDLARVGLWMAEQRATPAVRAIARGGDRAAFAAAGQSTRPGFSYRSGWWVDHPAGAWNALGVFGQRLHVAPGDDIVIARFGSHPVASNAATDAAHATLFAAIGDALRSARAAGHACPAPR